MSALFQSLLGFLMRCDEMVLRRRRGNTEFQSLLGFLMRCDVYVDYDATDADSEFQSLLGFLMRCDAAEGEWSSAAV